MKPSAIFSIVIRRAESSCNFGRTAGLVQGHSAMQIAHPAKSVKAGRHLSKFTYQRSTPRTICFHGDHPWCGNASSVASSDLAFLVDITSCILHAKADRFLANIKSDVVHIVFEKRPWCFRLLRGRVASRSDLAAVLHYYLETGHSCRRKWPGVPEPHHRPVLPHFTSPAGLDSPGKRVPGMRMEERKVSPSRTPNAVGWPSLKC